MDSRRPITIIRKKKFEIRLFHQMSTLCGFKRFFCRGLSKKIMSPCRSTDESWLSVRAHLELNLLDQKLFVENSKILSTYVYRARWFDVPFLRTKTAASFHVYRHLAHIMHEPGLNRCLPFHPPARRYTVVTIQIHNESMLLLLLVQPPEFEGVDGVLSC